MSSTVCPEPAAYRYTWPGKSESRVCVKHSGKVMSVASAIGLPLSIVPLMVEEVLADDKCCQEEESE